MATYTSKYLGELRTECTHIQSGTSILTDAPTDNMGKGQAFSPTDLVATALGTCIITTIAIFGAREGLTFDGSIINGTKIMTTDGPRKIEKIVLDINIKVNTDLSHEQKEKYERIAHTCPVAKSLHPDLIQEVSINWIK
jgi:putative redox protein